MVLLLHWQQAAQSVQTWRDYHRKSYTAVIHNMITCDLECPRHDNCKILQLQCRWHKKKNTLIADTITGNPVVYIVGYKANKYYK